MHSAVARSRSAHHGRAGRARTDAPLPALVALPTIGLLSAGLWWLLWCAVAPGL